MSVGKHHVLAVIELGTTSIRMVVGEASANKQIRKLDELAQAVALGSETLATGRIGRDATERCVQAIRSFREVLTEYGVETRHVRVVATSAVREASNSDRFCDRILVATGFEVEMLDQAEVSRLTYRAIQPQLRKQPFFRGSDVMVVEVGGGSTETLMFRKGKVSTSHLYRLGALRLRAQVEDQEVPSERRLGVMRAEMTQLVAQVHFNLKPLTSPQMVWLGSEARFALTVLEGAPDDSGLHELRLPALKRFMRKVVAQSVDELVKAYRLTYTEAETLGPALLIAVTLAEVLKLDRLHVGKVSLRTGILIEMATGEGWTAEYRQQVINSALAIARKYGVDLRHARHVDAYGSQIIKVLREQYAITPRDEVIFHVAALLHEVGQTINTASHHKHSQYMINNIDIFGLGRHDITLAALVARYHRRAMPKPSHIDYMALNHGDRITVSKLAAILRVANALDRLRSARPLKLAMGLSEKGFLIELVGDLDLNLLKQRVADQSQLFMDIFGKEIALQAKEK
ncbi:MAG: exopolyphosphatase [Lentisphaerae bacterium]|nr:exopolyphosphatase [Lentisphaerota bacterium]